MSAADPCPPRPAERLFLALPGDALPGPETGTPSSRLGQLTVPTDLRPVLGRSLWYREALPADASVAERVLPDGAVRLALNLSGASPSAVVIGPRASAEIVVLQDRMEGLSIEVRPGATQALLGIEAGEIAGQVLPLSDLWGRPGADLADRLAEVRAANDMTACLWSAIRWRMVGRNVDLQATVLAALLDGSTQDAQVARRLGVGERRLQQLCSAHLGLDPRTIRRLTRWHGLLRDLRNAERPDWAGLAAGHGWSDQAHMVRDFRAFSGLTPTEYLAAVSHSFKTDAVFGG